MDAVRFSLASELGAPPADPLEGAAPPDETLGQAYQRLAGIERREGGRLGVAVIDTGTGARLEHRAGERFPMCSTFKALASAAVLKRVDEAGSGSIGLSPMGTAISWNMRR